MKENRLLQFTIYSSLFTILASAALAAQAPSWWTERHVLNGEPAEHHNPVNQGQLKWLASQAAAEFEEKVPGPGNEAIFQSVQNFPVGHDFRPANLGMLKNTAKPFYDRLIELGWVSDYPWSGKTPADYNLANQGQAKNLFAFDLDAIDINQDGIPDWWTRLYGTTFTDENGSPISVEAAYAQWMHTGEDDPVGDGATDPVGQPTDTLVLNGSAVSGVLGTWIPEGTSIRAATRRGQVQYTANLPEPDIYRIQVRISQGKILSNDSQYYDLRYAINGQFIARQRHWLQGATSATVEFETPHLAAGLNTVQIYWDNPENGLSLRIEELRFQQWHGTDSNSNGIQDWVENRLIVRNGIDLCPHESAVSPVCIEGRGAYARMCRINETTVTPGGNDTWYADIALPEDGIEANLTVSLENGGRVLDRKVRWKTTDLLTGLVPTYLRVGDALRLTAAPYNAVSGTAEITVSNQILEVSVGEAYPFTFTEPGTYTLNAVFTGTDENNAPLSATRTVTVTVLGVEPEIIAAQVGQPRPWQRPEAWHSWARVEWDSGVQFGNDGTNDTLRIAVPEETYGKIRLGNNGPVLAPLVIKGFNLWAMRNTDLYYETVYPDGSFRAETTLIMSPVLPEVWIEQRCRGPVAYLDGSRVRNFTASDFDTLGEVLIVFAHSSPLAHSVCHYTDAYQGNVLIGVGY